MAATATVGTSAGTVAATGGTDEGPDIDAGNERLHRMIEAVKVAFADAYEYVTDPEAERIPTETMLSKEYASDRADEIGPSVGSYGEPDGRATPSTSPSSTATAMPSR